MVFSQHTKPLLKFFAIGAFIVSMLMSGLAHAEYALNFQEPVTDVARDIYGLHMTIFSSRSSSGMVSINSSKILSKVSLRSFLPTNDLATA